MQGKQYVTHLVVEVAEPVQILFKSLADISGNAPFPPLLACIQGRLGFDQQPADDSCDQEYAFSSLRDTFGNLPGQRGPHSIRSPLQRLFRRQQTRLHVVLNVGLAEVNGITEIDFDCRSPFELRTRS